MGPQEQGVEPAPATSPPDRESPSPRRGEPARDRALTVDYHRLFLSAADAILIFDESGCYDNANPAAVELTGYTVEELRSLRVGDLVPPDDKDYSTNRFRLLRTSGRSRGQRRLLRKDGTIVPVEAHAVALGGGLYQTTLRDVTEQTRAREALQQSLDAYSTLVDLCHAAVISSGADGRIQSWNPAAQTLFGYRADEVIGQPIEMLIPEHLREDHHAGFHRHLGRAAESRFARALTTEGLRKDGSHPLLEIALAVGSRGRERMFTAVVRDITEHQEMVEKLNDALQRLQFQLDRMPLAYIVWDKGFRVTEWNPAAERMFGYTNAEAMGRHAYELVVPPDAKPVVDEIWARLLEGEMSSHSINANVRKNGSRLICEWFNMPLRDSSGRIRGVASMAADVSEREAIEARVRDAQKLESLGVLAGGIAHDFNSSLMVMLGNTALLRATKGLPTNAIEHIELIETAGSRASELVKHLLMYARTGRHNPQPTDINAVIQDTLKLVRSSIGTRHTLDVDLCDPLPLVIADASQVAQVILNLCLNAKEAMADKGTISLKTNKVRLTTDQIRRAVPFDTKPGDYIEITVTDSGVGMDAETQARMFDPFFTRKAEGHGLGMAAVLGILRQHNSSAVVDSQPGKGTRVHVYFPVHNTHAEEKASVKSTRRSGSKKRRAVPRRRT